MNIQLRPSTLTVLCKDMSIDDSMPNAMAILETCLELALFLCQKNKKYGDSALNPVRALSKADPAEQLRVRMDDKISRLMRGQGGMDEDIPKDFVGYWVLLQIAERNAQKPTLTALNEAANAVAAPLAPFQIGKGQGYGDTTGDD